ncbi:hypothetical protein [Sphingomonas sp. PWP1-2]|uniref:hypothetical protein n=1 Tax=Sphingomonas sp. PWP1-2 TaxID=2804558 RepID=UPI003CE9774D
MVETTGLPAVCLDDSDALMVQYRVCRWLRDSELVGSTVGDTIDGLVQHMKAQQVSNLATRVALCILKFTPLVE